MLAARDVVFIRDLLTDRGVILTIRLVQSDSESAVEMTLDPVAYLARLLRDHLRRHLPGKVVLTHPSQKGVGGAACSDLFVMLCVRIWTDSVLSNNTTWAHAQKTSAPCRAKEKKMGPRAKDMVHWAFPSGPPPQYYPNSRQLNFAVRMGSGDPA